MVIIIIHMFIGDICKKGDDNSSDHICQTLNNCSTVTKLRLHNIKLRFCSFNKPIIPIVCCPPTNYAIVNTTKVKRSTSSVTVQTYSATESMHNIPVLLTFIKNQLSGPII